jgi:hypothetical protein
MRLPAARYVTIMPFPAALLDCELLPRQVHVRRTRSRCQRGTVSGVTSTRLWAQRQGPLLPAREARPRLATRQHAELVPQHRNPSRAPAGDVP